MNLKILRATNEDKMSLTKSTSSNDTKGLHNRLMSADADPSRNQIKYELNIRPCCYENVMRKPIKVKTGTTSVPDFSSENIKEIQKVLHPKLDILSLTMSNVRTREN